MMNDGALLTLGAVALLSGVGLLRRGSAALGKGPYPFAAKQQQYAAYANDQLHAAAADAWEAVQAMAPWNPDAEGWYRDDLSTIRAEMHRRGIAGGRS
jgi:hypothetical protein